MTMRRVFVTSLGFAATTLLFLVGCSAPIDSKQAAVSPLDRARVPELTHIVNAVDKIPAGAYAFVSSNTDNSIYVLNAASTIVATLVGNGLNLPQGLAVGRNPLKLYVANEVGADILVYTSKSSPVVLNNGGAEPSDVAVDRVGNVAAANWQTGTVTCFAPGATAPTKTIHTSGQNGSVATDAFDQAGNLYVAYSDDTFYGIGEIVGGCSGTTIIPLSTTNSLNGGPIQVENNGDIAVMSDDSAHSYDATIYAYRPPVNGSLGSPVTTTLLGGNGAYNYFAFTPGSQRVLVADGKDDYVVLYTFPGGVITGVQGLPPSAHPEGVATLPSEQY